MADFVFNAQPLIEHIKAIKDKLQTFVGKPGYNPFIWNAKNLAPLEKRLNDGEQTVELNNAIALLDVNSINPIAPGAEHNVMNPPKDHQAAGGFNAGQVLVQTQSGTGLSAIPLTNPNVK